MEKKLGQFTNYLEYKRRSPLTIRQYRDNVNSLNVWLLNRHKNIETADERDLRDWAQVKRNSSFYYSILEYCRFSNLENQEKIIRQIIKEAPKRKRESQALPIRWWQFKNYLAEIEDECKPHHFALFNLLWSELKLRDILNLQKSNVNFLSKTICLNGKDYYATKEAWLALEKYLRPEERGKNERLFHKLNGMRQAHDIIKKYFGRLKLVAGDIQKSCEQDLLNFGRKQMFLTPESSEHPFETEKINEQRLNVDTLFDAIVDGLTEFGKRFNSRIVQLNDEKELQRLIEGYLNAVLNNEIIRAEYAFEGYKENSRIDFTIGKEYIPIEVKLCGTKPIGDYIREGSSQVKEFLRFNDSAKGIVVIGDIHCHPQSKKHNGMHDNVYIIVI